MAESPLNSGLQQRFPHLPQMEGLRSYQSLAILRKLQRGRKLLKTSRLQVRVARGTLKKLQMSSKASRWPSWSAPIEGSGKLR